MATSGIIEGRMRVAVVDDDADTRLCFRDILHSEKKFSFAGGFPSATEALAGLPHLRLDLVLVDINLPDMDGIECTKRLRLLLPNLRVVIVSGNRQAIWFDRSLDVGASAYLIKPVDPAQLLVTLRFAATRVNALVEIPSGKSGYPIHLVLTQREHDVLSKLAEGLLYKEISDALCISYAAVHKCQHRIFKKLQVSNRSEAVRLWLESKIGQR